MRKELIFVFALLFVLASCSSGTTVSNNEKTFVGGTSGLLVNFVEGQPPADVTDGGQSPFTVSVKLENKGETNVSSTDVTLKLKGFDPVSFGLTGIAALTTSPTEDLWPTQINPDTGATIEPAPVFVDFPEMNYGEVLSGNSVFPFVVDVCYAYQTRATTQLCIKEDLQDTSTDICTVSGPKKVQNSGAPVHITAFEEYPSGANVRFQFTVKDVGNGLLSRSGQACDDSQANKDYVTVSVDTGMTGLSCSGLTTSGTVATGAVRLGSGERAVMCTQSISDNDRTDKIMIVDLTVNYDYQESKSTNVLVKHI